MDIRTKILAASTDLFLSSGIKSITMDDISQNLGMSKRTIYEHFENKRSLLMACVEYDHQLKMLREDDVVKDASNIIEEIFLLMRPSSAVEQANEHRFMMELKKYFPDIFNELISERYDTLSTRLSGRLKRGIEQGIIMHDVRMDIAIFVVFETVNSLMSHTDRLIEHNIKIEDAFRFTLISFFRGIATPKGVDLIDQIMK